MTLSSLEFDSHENKCTFVMKETVVIIMINIFIIFYNVFYTTAPLNLK